MVEGVSGLVHWALLSGSELLVLLVRMLLHPEVIGGNGDAVNLRGSAVLVHVSWLYTAMLVQPK